MRLVQRRGAAIFEERKRGIAVVLVGFGLALATAAPALAEPAAVESKEAQAQRVLAQVGQLDSRLEMAIEAYNLANERLGRTEQELADNGRHLRLARRNLGHAQAALSARLVAIYTAGERNGTLEVLLGATSLDDLLNRIDTVDRVSEQDAEVLRNVIAFRGEVQRRRARLRRARAEQARLVRERAAHRSSIQRQLGERRRLLSSIKHEIAELRAAERARQQALARQAQQRLAAQRRSLAQAAQPLAQSTVAQPAIAEAATAAPPPRYGGVVGIAMRYLGIPYKWGGASPSTGFDCSGFVMYVYAQVGVSLPHNAAAQYGVGSPVSRSELQPGDLVFFNGLGHNGIYIGGGQFIHSPHTGDVVKISSLSDSWYAATYVGARRP